MIGEHKMATFTMSIEEDGISRFVHELLTDLQRTPVEKAMEKGTLAGLNYNVSAETVDVIVESGGARVGFQIDCQGQVTRAWQEEPAPEETVPRHVYDCALDEARDMAARNMALEAALRTWYAATPLELTPHFPNVEEGEPCPCKFCKMTRRLLDEPMNVADDSDRHCPNPACGARNRLVEDDDGTVWCLACGQQIRSST
jgi:hypothetical protein